MSMADYLIPETEVTTEQKCQIFSVRSEKNKNPYNYENLIFCCFGCTEEQNNSHMLNRLRTNKNGETFNYEDLLNGPLQLIIEIFKTFERNINRRKQQFSVNCQSTVSTV